MDWFFDEWVKETGIPHYAVKFDVKPHGNEFIVTGRLEQSGVDDLFTAPVPIYASRPGPGSKPLRLGVRNHQRTGNCASDSLREFDRPIW